MEMGDVAPCSWDGAAEKRNVCCWELGEGCLQPIRTALTVSLSPRGEQDPAAEVPALWRELRPEPVAHLSRAPRSRCGLRL